MNLALNALCDATRLQDIEYRRNDEVFLDALGTDSIPDPTTAGDFCHRFTAESLEDLQLTIDPTTLGGVGPGAGLEIGQGPKDFGPTSDLLYTKLAISSEPSPLLCSNTSPASLQYGWRNHFVPLSTLFPAFLENFHASQTCQESHARGGGQPCLRLQ